MVFSTNLFEGLKVLHRLPWTWKFASHNFQPVVLATAEYHPPSWVPKVLFSGILLWQLIIVLLFGWAIISSLKNLWLNWGLVNAAFAGGWVSGERLCLPMSSARNTTRSGPMYCFLPPNWSTLTALHILP